MTLVCLFQEIGVKSEQSGLGYEVRWVSVTDGQPVYRVVDWDTQSYEPFGSQGRITRSLQGYADSRLFIGQVSAHSLKICRQRELSTPAFY